jgi:hypothetical protein
MEIAMSRLAPLCVVGALLMAVPALAQSSMLVGTWKENIAKSKFTPGPAPRARTLKWEPAAGGLKFTVETLNAQGQTVNTENIERNDGSDGAVQGADGKPTGTLRSLKRIDDHTYEDMDKRDGKTMFTRRMVISPDGKTLMITVTGTNAQGQKVSNVEVFEKQ